MMSATETAPDPMVELGKLSDFKPVAYYDKHLDCIRVHIRDCSVLEDRKNPIFTVLRAAHSRNGTVAGNLVGLNIKGVRHIFNKLGLGDKQACYALAQVLGFVVQVYPEQGVKEIADMFRPVAEDAGLQVEVNFSVSAA